MFKTSCSVRTCPGLDPPQNGTLSTERATVGTEVRVQCDPGYLMENHTIQYTMLCTDDLVWNDTVMNCTGVYPVVNQGHSSVHFDLTCGPVLPLVTSIQ